MEHHDLIKQYIVAKNSIQLKNVTLVESNFKQLANTNNLEHSLGFGYKVEQVNNKVYGYLSTSIKSKNEQGEDALTIKVVYKGEYIPNDDSIDLETLIQFAEIQTVPQLIAYARAHILSTSSQMIQEPVYLPTMDIIESLIKNADH